MIRLIRTDRGDGQNSQMKKSVFKEVKSFFIERPLPTISAVFVLGFLMTISLTLIGVYTDNSTGVFISFIGQAILIPAYIATLITTFIRNKMNFEFVLKLVLAIAVLFLAYDSISNLITILKYGWIKCDLCP